MDKIMEGTTPTATYTFRTVNPAEFVTAFFTVKIDDEVVIEKTLADAEIEENKIRWKLTQEETLLIGTRTGKAMCNWKLPDGTRGTSSESDFMEPANT